MFKDYFKYNLGGKINKLNRIIASTKTFVNQDNSLIINLTVTHK